MNALDTAVCLGIPAGLADDRRIDPPSVRFQSDMALVCAFTPIWAARYPSIGGSRRDTARVEACMPKYEQDHGQVPQDQAPRFMSRKEILRITTWSASTLRREIARGRFPRPTRTSPGRVGWLSSRVRTWLESFDDEK
jgi:predicted DNA-binding transcriptional regulator AlpA